MVDTELSHSALIARAAQWLRTAKGCRIVLTEVGGRDSELGRIERADAIGWTHPGSSTLVECKTTVADFRADAQKPHRARLGLGLFRFFLMPVDVADRVELPPGWGLLRPWGERSCRIVTQSATFAASALLEQRVLFWQTVRAVAKFDVLDRSMRKIARSVRCDRHAAGLAYAFTTQCVYCGVPRGYEIAGGSDG